MQVLDHPEIDPPAEFLAIGNATDCWTDVAAVGEMPRVVLRMLVAALFMVATACGGAGQQGGQPASSGQPSISPQPNEQSASSGTPSVRQATGSADRTTVQSLLAAPIPGLCDHKPAHLVNGVLPLQDPYNGFVSISTFNSKGDYETVTGDLTGDGVDDGALVTACTAGGVSWADTVQVYTGNIKRLGGVDLGDVTAGGRETVTAIGIADNRVQLEWTTTADDDAACCGSVPVTATLRWTGKKLAVEGLERHYDRQTVIKLITSDDRDEAELRARLADESILEPLEYLRYIAPGLEERGCFGHPTTDAGFPREALSGKAATALDPNRLATRYCILQAKPGDWANSAVIGLQPVSDTTWHATFYSGPKDG